LLGVGEVSAVPVGAGAAVTMVAGCFAHPRIMSAGARKTTAAIPDRFIVIPFWSHSGTAPCLALTA
jgi:hypothetical protein